MNFIRLKEACELTGKSRTTVTRLVHKAYKNTESQKYIDKRYDDTNKKNYYLIDKAYLLSVYPEIEEDEEIELEAAELYAMIERLEASMTKMAQKMAERQHHYEEIVRMLMLKMEKQFKLLQRMQEQQEREQKMKAQLEQLKQDKQFLRDEIMAVRAQNATEVNEFNRAKRELRAIIAQQQEQLNTQNQPPIPQKMPHNKKWWQI